MMLLPMLLVVGAIAALAGGRPRPQDRGPATSTVGGRRRPTTATAVLMEFIRVGRRPPPALIASALAEAQRAGQDELAMAIVDTYIRPVVDAAEHTPYHPSWAPSLTALTAPNAPPSLPGPVPYDYEFADDPRGQAPSYYDPHYQDPRYQDPRYQDPRYGSPYATPTPASSPPAAPAPAMSPVFSPPPSGVSEAYPATAPISPTAPGPAPVASPQPGAWSPGGAVTPMIPLGTGASDEEILRMISHLSNPPQTAAAQGAPPPGEGTFDPTSPLGGPPSATGLGPGTGPGTITVSGRSSPIDGVGSTEWARFCDRMSRELPTYTSVHHVGQFRQRRGRLLELGIDPETVLAYPEHQRVAFDTDMSEAYRRAHAAGLLACVGHPVEVPTPDGPPQVAQVTTSGVLGVVQAAGVEGAVGWFRSPEDRRRFGGTTAIFSRANGVF